MKNDFITPKYVTTFHAKKENGVWKAWTEKDGKRFNERYCLNRKHAERTRTSLVNRFWSNSLN